MLNNVMLNVKCFMLNKKFGLNNMFSALDFCLISGASIINDDFDIWAVPAQEEMLPLSHVFFSNRSITYVFHFLKF
jgi:hypothetical protein